jgi:hypothetical protein
MRHGKSNTRLYRVWSRIKVRCYNKKFQHYKSYGGRGIKVCDEWLNDFMAFYNWAMANGYADNLTIDRIDVNGNYEPSNCRWVTNEEQQNNKRNTIFLTYKGKRQTITQWANELMISRDIIERRYRRGYIDKACLFGTKVLYKKYNL